MPPLNGSRDSCTFGKRPHGSNLKSTSVRFSRDIFQSPRHRRFGCLRKARFLHSPPSPPLPTLLRCGRPSVFSCLFRGPQRARSATIPPHNSKRATLIQPRPPPLYLHLPFKGGSLFPTARFDEKVHPSCEWKMYLSSAVIHLTSFALSIRCLV